MTHFQAILASKANPAAHLQRALVPSVNRVARFRLRFLLQEVDLRQSETTIGRSPECHITIEDPLVSREHARLTLSGGEASVTDLGSRNGTLVNGDRITGKRKLSDGDRIRIGTQEFVLSRLSDQRQSPSRRTGFLTRCAKCSTPYPEEAPACPTCGGTSKVDEETMSGAVPTDPSNWPLQLLVEVLERAAATERWPDVERLLSRCRSNVERRAAAGQALDVGRLSAVGVACCRLATAQGDPSWLRWLLSAHASYEVSPAPQLIEALEALPSALRTAIVSEAWALADSMRQRADTGGLGERLESLAARSTS